MATQTRSRIGSKVAATVFAAAMALGIGLSSGVVHAQPNGNGYNGDPCYINGMGPFPDGTIRFFNGVTQVCKGGEWVIYVRDVAPTQPIHKGLNVGAVQDVGASLN